MFEKKKKEGPVSTNLLHNFQTLKRSYSGGENVVVI